MTTESNAEQQTVSYDENLGIEFGIDDNIKNSDETLDDKTNSSKDESKDISINDFLENQTNADKQNSEPVNIRKKTIDTKVSDDKKEITEDVKSDELLKENKDILSSTVAFGRYLQEQGSFDFNEEKYQNEVKEKGEAQAFLNLMEDQANQSANNHIKTLDQYSKEYIEFRNAGFSKEEASDYTSAHEKINNITDEELSDNEELQIKIVKQISKLRGMSDDEINDNIELLKDTDKLENRSKNHLKVLQDYYKAVNEQMIEKQKNEIILQEKANNDYFTELRKEIDETDEYIKGNKITKQVKDKIFDIISTPIKLKDGGVTNGIWEKRSKDPKAFDRKLAYYIVTGLFDGDAKDIHSDTRTKILSELEQNFNNGQNFNTGRPNINSDDKSLHSKLEEMKGLFD